MPNTQKFTKSKSGFAVIIAIQACPGIAVFEASCYDGAQYLTGYVVELALKARICRVLDIDDYPDTGEISRSFKTHKLDQLMKLAGLGKKFETAYTMNRELRTNWSILSTWNEAFRYNPVGTSEEENIRELIEALEDRNEGVFTWIKKYW